jgi:2-polyprenyl-3-methyl-5-hydroxy-6-metoxy-1,4-benzoquinol methylase
LPCPNIDEEKRFYDKNKQDKAIHEEINIDELRSNFMHDTLRRADFISKRFSTENKILDVGCGYGFFLEEMSRRGYKIAGVEISKERRELAETVTDCNIFDINFEDGVDSSIYKFDAVTLFHVLEHAVDPIEFCRNVKNVIKENGCLVIEVPNVNELMLETCQSYNKFYWIRAHLNYFSKKTLSTVLKKAGFSNIEILFVQRYGVENMVNWISTGTPQIKKPVFTIPDPYKWLEDYYRNYLEDTGRSDAIVAVAKVK